MIGSIEEDNKLKEKIEIYSQMDKKAVARIFETLSSDLDLLIDILSNMKAEDASEILSVMDKDLAGKITKEIFK